MITAQQYIDLLNATSLGERRPVGEPARIAKMIENANLLVTAWDGEVLVGASRCLSDFSYVTYCSDLCVRESHQRLGIGKELLRKTLEAGGCRVVLLAAPKAVDYYPRIGFTKHPSAWTISPGEL
jgi:predicted N-acetyltransferase YhbS